MLIVPDKLLRQPSIEVYVHTPRFTYLKKNLRQSLEGRESYVSMHAITMVWEGRQIIRSEEGERLDIRPGQFALVKKGIYTITDLIAPSKGCFTSFLLYFEDKFLEEWLKQGAASSPISHNPRPKDLWAFETPPYMDIYWKSMDLLARDYGDEGVELAEIKARELFAILQAAHPTFYKKVQALSQAKPKSLKEFMERNYDKSLSIEDYAYLSGRSESTFRREFKNKFDITPRRWIIQRRMKKALDLLQRTDWEVGRIAGAVGYENTSHFINEFKKRYGYTPSQFSPLHKLQLDKIDRKTAS